MPPSSATRASRASGAFASKRAAASALAPYVRVSVEETPSNRECAFEARKLAEQARRISCAPSGRRRSCGRPGRESTSVRCARACAARGRTPRPAARRGRDATTEPRWVQETRRPAPAPPRHPLRPADRRRSSRRERGHRAAARRSRPASTMTVGKASSAESPLGGSGRALCAALREDWREWDAARRRRDLRQALAGEERRFRAFGVAQRLDRNVRRVFGSDAGARLSDRSAASSPSPRQPATVAATACARRRGAGAESGRFGVRLARRADGNHGSSECLRNRARWRALAVGFLAERPRRGGRAADGSDGHRCDGASRGASRRGGGGGVLEKRRASERAAPSERRRVPRRALRGSAATTSRFGGGRDGSMTCGSGRPALLLNDHALERGRDERRERDHVADRLEGHVALAVIAVQNEHGATAHADRKHQTWEPGRRRDPWRARHRVRRPDARARRPPHRARERARSAGRAGRRSIAPWRGARRDRARRAPRRDRRAPRTAPRTRNIAPRSRRSDSEHLVARRGSQEVALGHRGRVRAEPPGASRLFGLGAGERTRDSEVVGVAVPAPARRSRHDAAARRLWRGGGASVGGRSMRGASAGG